MMLSDRDIEIQARQFVEGGMLKGMYFEQWADSKDFSLDDRERIKDRLESWGAIATYQKSIPHEKVCI